MLLRLSVLAASLALWLPAQDLKEFEKQVTEFTLPNGLHLIVLERHQAPVVSFHTYVDAGSVDDPKGATGLAHMFEHMAFKGTDTIGTTNFTQEKKALEAVERAWDRYESEHTRLGHTTQSLSAVKNELDAAIESANGYVVPNAYPRLIEENGGVGLNASTGEDSTNYFYSLPSNRTELWFLLESQRFLHPVFREFYKERDVVREERRMRVESSAEGKLMESLLASAFAAHPYREPTAGWPSDIEHLRAIDAQAFYERYYTAANITIAIAGDVQPDQVRRFAERYFGPLPARPRPNPVLTEEPPPAGPKRINVLTPGEPFLAIVYPRPVQNHPDDPVFDVISSILDAGRTGLLYRDLIRDRQIALTAAASATFPSGKYPNLFLFWIAPNSGHTTEENEQAVYAILERLKKEPVDTQTLARVKTRIRASLIHQLASNSGMASELAFYHVNYGNWRWLFEGLAQIDRVTAEDVQRVAREYFKDSARTVAYTTAPAGGAAK